jgi:acetylornithine deacetylase/succinyl-diaminopimelate desuccinylase-like protein
VSALARLVDRPLRWRVTPAARAYLRGLAPLHGPRWQPVLTDPDRFISPEGPNGGGLLLPGMENLFLDTVQVNVLAGSAQVNVVPGRAIARVDMRLLPDTDGDAFLAEVRQRLGDDVDIEVLLTSPPLAPTSTTTAAYRQLERALATEAPVVPFFSPGFTDSRLFRARGIPAYGFSPFTIEPQDLLGIHGADERIPVAELDRGVERLQRIVQGWALDSP